MLAVALLGRDVPSRSALCAMCCRSHLERTPQCKRGTRRMAEEGVSYSRPATLVGCEIGADRRRRLARITPQFSGRAAPCRVPLQLLVIRQRASPRTPLSATSVVSAAPG